MKPIHGAPGSTVIIVAARALLDGPRTGSAAMANASPNPGMRGKRARSLLHILMPSKGEMGRRCAIEARYGALNGTDRNRLIVQFQESPGKAIPRVVRLALARQKWPGHGPASGRCFRTSPRW